MASSQDGELLRRLRNGDKSVIGEFIDLYREPLRRMIELRMDARLAGRLSCADVLQDVSIVALQRIDHYLAKPEFPFHIWLRMLAGQCLIDTRRKHLGAQKRDAGCEIPLHGKAFPQANSVSMAGVLLGHLTSPSDALIRKEQVATMESALDRMDATDREVLTMRHFEHMENEEVAAALGLTITAASKRYVRALRRLKEAMAHLKA